MTEEIASKFSSQLEPDAVEFSTIATQGATTGMSVAAKAVIIGISVSVVIAIAVAITTSAVLTSYTILKNIK